MSGIWSSGTDHVFLITEQTDDGLSKQVNFFIEHKRNFYVVLLLDLRRSNERIGSIKHVFSQLILELSHAHPSTTVVWMLGDAAITSLPVPALLLYQPNGTFTVLLECVRFYNITILIG